MTIAYPLDALGWDESFARAFEPFAAEGLEPARVALEYNYLFRVFSARGEFIAEAAGRLKHKATKRSELPAVGDWVAIRQAPGEDRATMQAVLPRRSRFSRKVAGTKTDEQIVAANVDRALIVMALDNDFSPRRIERYLVLAWEGGVEPSVVLNKADLCPDVEARVREVEAAAADVPIHVTSFKTGQGMDALRAYFERGKTLALLGSSGVGKSTFVNRVLGTDVLPTQEVRASDATGRHTTRHRQLIVLPEGGLIIDTPGLRELQLWEGAESIDEVFHDIEAIAEHCRFRDCRHSTEPRCAVKQAVADGTLPAERLENYQKLQREFDQFAVRHDKALQSEQNKRNRPLHRIMRDLKPRE
jgi:ribosome biogenesis GTPase